MMRRRDGERRPTLVVRSRPVTVAGIVLAAFVAGLSLIVGDPVVFPVRFAFVVALIGVATLASFAALSTRRGPVAALLAISAGLVAWQGARPSIDRAVVLGRTDAAVLQVERRFVVGYRDPAAGRELALSGRVGGLFLTRRNVSGRSAAELSSWIADLQAARRAVGLPSLVVAADQEGGPVSHLSPPLPTLPALSALAGLPQAARRPAAEHAGAEQGIALRSIGVTLDLAPVSDLVPAEPPGVLDRHTRIATRAISADPVIVADIAAGFSKGLLDVGIIPTAKHFPGLGGVTTDTHLFAASLETAIDKLENTDWMPFRTVLATPGAAVMLSHVSLDSVDPGVPASRSRRLVDGVLRLSGDTVNPSGGDTRNPSPLRSRDSSNDRYFDEFSTRDRRAETADENAGRSRSYPAVA